MLFLEADIHPYLNIESILSTINRGFTFHRRCRYDFELLVIWVVNLSFIIKPRILIFILMNWTYINELHLPEMYDKIFQLWHTFSENLTSKFTYVINWRGWIANIMIIVYHCWSLRWMYMTGMFMWNIDRTRRWRWFLLVRVMPIIVTWNMIRTGWNTWMPVVILII